jgi:hypothetical protein
VSITETAAVWMALVEHQRRTVRPMRRARMWERIARRRAGIIARQEGQLRAQARLLMERNDEITDLKARVSILEFFAFNEDRPDGSGREYPQAWQPERAHPQTGNRPIYRQSENRVEFWSASIPGEGTDGWSRCGTTYRTMDDVRKWWSVYEEIALVAVPSPDCKNCDGTGHVPNGHGGRGPICPVCMGGAN